MKQYLTLLILILTLGNLFGQGWQQNLGTPNRDQISDLQQTNDGGYILTGYTSTSPTNVLYDLYLIKTDINGHTLWKKKHGSYQRDKGFAVQQTTDGGYIVTGITYSYGVNNGDANVYLVKTDANGDTLWTKHYGDTGFDEARSVQQANDQGYFVFGTTTNTSANSKDMYLIRTDRFGDTLWTKTYGTDTTRDEGRYIDPTADGGYIMTGISPTNIKLIKIDSNGTTQWFKNYDYSLLQTGEVHQTTDGGYIISGYRFDGSNTYHHLIKTDNNGDTLWTRDYGKTLYNSLNSISSVQETADGGYIIARDFYTLYLTKTNSSGQPEWEKEFATNAIDEHNFKVVQNLDNSYTFTYFDQHPFQNHFDIFLTKTDSLGAIYSGSLSGYIYQDENANCTHDTLIDPALKNIIVKAESSSKILYITSDNNGYYHTDIDTGTYTVSIPYNIPYYTFNCQPYIGSVYIDSLHQNDTANFALTPLFRCPLLYVDISAPIIRPTVASNYTVYYSNKGTANAQNAYVEVTLDTILSLLNSSIPIASQQGNTYTFNIGALNIQQDGNFTLNIIADSSAILGQFICSEVHIYPDSICLPNFWNGPKLFASAKCLNDTVFFEVRNKGATMSTGTDYYVYEDNIMLRTGTTTSLGINGTEQIKQPAALGKTYRFEVEQATGFPTLLGDSIASVNIANCTPIPNPPPNNFLVQFSNGNSAPFEAINCQPLVNSYDPNDKSVQPIGYGTNHFIYDHTALDYKIRFQNTGTDTAFTVVIRDTLSPHLDLASIQMGASSHAYTWRVYGSNILEVTFNNILLPDSSTNELASHGFFRFRIEQAVNNPLGAVIYNSAAIYFDYNAPIITNQTFHTIGENFVIIQLLGTDNIVSNDPISIQVYPNPFKEQTLINIEGQDYTTLNLKIYDLTGKLIQQQQGMGNQLILKRNQLQQGLYIYQLEGNGKLLNTGKLIVQ